MDLVKLDCCDFELFLSFFELFTKGSDLLDDVPKLNDVDDPRAETSSSFRFIFDDLRIELRVGEIVFLTTATLAGGSSLALTISLKLSRAVMNA